METTRFTAVCERAGRWWTIRVPQVEGLVTQVRSLDQAEIIARQSIARVLGVPPEAITVEVHSDAPAPVAQALQARRAARLAVAAADQATQEALGALAHDGYAFHDAVTLLALSPAEIAQYGPVPAGPDPAGWGQGRPGEPGPAGPGAAGWQRPSGSPLQLAGQ
jgi:hypothetical protein